ncbi:MAG: iron-containing alcohol dehydrogenase [Clostridiaceae bacterium]|nr:iron-containing alcohol dehydrogenase [Clostridiaceae bacterium]
MKFYLPTKIYQEPDAVRKHSREMAVLGKKALIVTGRNSSSKNDSLKDVIQGLEHFQTAYLVFDRIEENPSVETVMEAAEIGRREGADFVIGIGGGSPMDAAKAIALMIQNRDSSSEVLYQDIPLKAVPVAEVPTTCGTGSEVTPYAILTRHDLQTKQSISHRIFPSLALVDGKYLASAPLSVITNTAIDALGHLLESYFHANATDYSRIFCQFGMEAWAAGAGILFGMEASPEDYQRMMYASSLAGIAISHTGTSLPHGLSYYLTYQKGIPHGKAVGLFLPAYLQLLPEEYEVQRLMALRSLGFGSLEQFDGFIREMLGSISLSEEELLALGESVLRNPSKLFTAPFEVTEEEIAMMCRYAAKA